MNDATKALDVILSRRSIRSYENKPLNDTIFEHLLKAAMTAPSAHNQQPWEFVIIDERKLLDQIPEFHPYSKMLLGAPAAILVCGNKNYIKDEDLWPQDCAAATENILLAATALQLGSVWLGVYPKRDLMEGLSKLLNLPENIIPFSLVALGFPAKTKEPANRYDPSRVHKNKW
ncbi:nitroreductase [Thermovirga lienii DSM 17291]|uniref:Nitroreductase n=1 Tax=Thermovirga lienii (strain ATCC BAA-1197 / DSM 17291 / Cas60314) TaxID=580340 RepID=G7V759_THELD|nr:nitroreductase family protein [Thermovirga lienii]AER66093.1 nitroreductase [Thermovirga lienii DSM 17291]